MRKGTIEIECKTSGFEDATDRVEALANAYDGFPAQVNIRNCHDCVFNIHPSQAQFYNAGGDEEEDEEE